MGDIDRAETWALFGLLFKAHPWHGVPIGPEAPDVVTAYIEIVPTDTVKYEIDKPTGHLKVDRPQKYSNVCPTLYGFIPQTFCGEQVAALSQERTGLATVEGDGDPLDVCVLSEKVFSRGDILLQAVPIGGLRLIDKRQADDKIVAVLKAMRRSAAAGRSRTCRRRLSSGSGTTSSPISCRPARGRRPRRSRSPTSTVAPRPAQ